MPESKPDPRLSAAVLDVARRQREKMDAMERAVATMLPLVGFIDCTNCGGAGAFFEIQYRPRSLLLGDLSIGDVRSLEILRPCTCATIT
jgi:hypothetical protein